MKKGSRVLFRPCLSLLIFSLFFNNYPCQYLYPVDYYTVDDTVKIMLIYQKSLFDIQLLSWDPHSLYIEPLLSSIHNPIQVTSIPGNNSFSFIDQGVIRCKDFIKRSSRLLPIYSSISSFNNIHWLNETSFYCSAQKGLNNGIFQINTQGIMHTIQLKKGIDCLYPQTIKNSLFYIEYSPDNKQSIMHMNYPKIPEMDYSCNNDSTDCSQNLLSVSETNDLTIKKAESGTKEILSMRDNVIGFLNMISLKKGYFVEFLGNTEPYPLYVTCNYHCLQKKDGLWESTVLFDFALPLNMITQKKEERIVESIMPLLPKIIIKNDTTVILYVDVQNSLHFDKLSCYIYNTKTHQKKRLFENEHGNLFTPCVVENICYFGGRINKKNLYIFIDKDNKLCCVLPQRILSIF